MTARLPWLFDSRAVGDLVELTGDLIAPSGDSLGDCEALEAVGDFERRSVSIGSIRVGENSQSINLAAESKCRI